MQIVLRTFSKPDLALAICLLGSALLIMGAHGFERIGGMAPCLLCLDQREAHWAALGLGALALAAAKFGGRTRVFTAALGALSLLYLFSACLAGYHAGVEWGFWPGPQGCSALPLPEVASADEIFGSLDGVASGPSCSEAAWRMLGVSMAGYNAILSLGFAFVAGLSFIRVARTLRKERVQSVSAGAMNV